MKQFSIFHLPSSIVASCFSGAWSLVLGILALGIITTIRLYQIFASPLLTAIFGATAGCRYTPTCSCYAREAVQTHGAFRGTWLAARRVCRCHPWGGHGEDPVPPNLKFPITPSRLTHG